MNWKSTALVSGATLVATWLASAPAVRQPVARVNAPVRQPAHSAEAASDIVREADRLREKLSAAVAYREPGRNPFRFGQAAHSHTAALPAPAEAAPPAVPTAPQAPTLRITLSGIAEDTAGSQVVRTAVISSGEDLLLVKEGETVAGQYRVSAIASDSVELTRTVDGVTIRLGLRP